MDTESLVLLRRGFAAARSRRGALAGLGGGLFTALPLALGLNETAAKKKRKKNKRKRKKPKRQGAEPLPPPPTPPPATPPPPPGPVTRVDAVCPAGENKANLLEPGEKAQVAQTFTAGLSGQFVGAELTIVKPAGSSGDYVLQLTFTDNDGFPLEEGFSGEVLEEVVVADADVPEGASVVTFPFSGAIPTVAGFEYALLLGRPGSDGVTVAGRVNNPCAGRAFTRTDRDSPFTAVGDFDFTFATFVTA